MNQDFFFSESSNEELKLKFNSQRITTSWEIHAKYIYIYMYVCIYIYVYVYIYMYMYICICTHTHTHTHTYIYIYISYHWYKKQVISINSKLNITKINSWNFNKFLFTKAAIDITFHCNYRKLVNLLKNSNSFKLKNTQLILITPWHSIRHLVIQQELKYSYLFQISLKSRNYHRSK